VRADFTSQVCGNALFTAEDAEGAEDTFGRRVDSERYYRSWAPGRLNASASAFLCILCGEKAVATSTRPPN